MLIKIAKPGHIYSTLRRKLKRKSDIWRNDEIREVLNTFGIHKWQTCRNYYGGSSDNVSINTKLGKKLLKRYYLDVPSTVYEHSILKHLIKHRFETPKLNINNAGLTYTVRKKRHYAVYDYVEGYCYSNYFFTKSKQLQLISKAGIALAKLHTLMEGFIPSEGRKFNGFMLHEHRLWRNVQWHVTVIDKFIKKNKVSTKIDKNFLLRILPEAKKDLIQIGKYFDRPLKQLPKLIIHGDYSPQNILFKRKNLLSVLDFSDADLNLRVLDIARGLSSFTAIPKGNGIDLKLAKLFLEAYHKEIYLNNEEIKAIPAMILWRYLQNLTWPLYDNNPYRKKIDPNLKFMILDKLWKKILWIKRNKEILQYEFIKAT